jgi:hypothetical protein
VHPLDAEAGAIFPPFGKKKEKYLLTNWILITANCELITEKISSLDAIFREYICGNVSHIYVHKK